MRLTILQTTIQWEQPATNRALLAEQLTALSGRTDLVVLPEMFSTGFTMNAAALAEPMDGPTIRWMREQSARLNAAITGSFICRDGGQFYNRLVFAYPDGQIRQYDKRHLFGLADEHETYTPGTERLIVEWQGFRICPLVCYDLRFPVWSRQPAPDTAEPAFDLLIYVANWPVPRSRHWRALLQARAIENQCFVAGVNITGSDGKGHLYQGDSAIIDYSGTHFCRITDHAGCFTAKLSLEDLTKYRQSLPFLKDADPFSV